MKPKQTLFILPLFVFTIYLTSNISYAANGFTGNLNLLGGGKVLDDNWAPFISQHEHGSSINTHTEFGINLDFGKTSWPVHIDIAYLSSTCDGDETWSDTNFEDIFVWGRISSESHTVHTEASTSESRLGVKYIGFDSRTAWGYIAAGISYIDAEIEMTGYNYSISISEEDSAVGCYIALGAGWTYFKHINLGFVTEYSYAQIDLNGYDSKPGGVHVLAFIGYHF